MDSVIGALLMGLGSEASSPGTLASGTGTVAPGKQCVTVLKKLDLRGYGVAHSRCGGDDERTRRCRGWMSTAGQAGDSHSAGVNSEVEQWHFMDEKGRGV